jgi:hypothetical protein
LIFARGDEKNAAYLLGLMSSLILDWYARRFVETHVTFFVLNPFPVPRPSEGSPLRQRMINISGRLASVDNRFEDWASQVGVEWGPLEEQTRQEMIHELDAVVAHLYGLNADQLTHIFETFHVGWDYQARLEATLAHFHNWSREL